jgi:hypothetical protein
MGSKFIYLSPHRLTKTAVYSIGHAEILPLQSGACLDPGDDLLRLGVRDNSTGLVETVNAPVTIAAAAQTAEP